MCIGKKATHAGRQQGVLFHQRTAQHYFLAHIIRIVCTALCLSGKQTVLEVEHTVLYVMMKKGATAFQREAIHSFIVLRSKAPPETSGLLLHLG